MEGVPVLDGVNERGTGPGKVSTEEVLVLDRCQRMGYRCRWEGRQP